MNSTFRRGNGGTRVDAVIAPAVHARGDRARSALPPAALHRASRRYDAGIGGLVAARLHPPRIMAVRPCEHGDRAQDSRDREALLPVEQPAPRRLRREPQRRSRMCPPQNESGNRSSVRTPSTRIGKRSARSHQGSSSTDGRSAAMASTPARELNLGRLGANLRSWRSRLEAACHAGSEAVVVLWSAEKHRGSSSIGFKPHARDCAREQLA